MSEGGELWTEADEAFELGLGTWGRPETIMDGPRALQEATAFRAWVEEWETKSRKKDDVLVREKLLKKYKGIRWIDQDARNTLVVCECVDVEYIRRGGGWHGVARDGNDGEVQPWDLKVGCESVADQERGKDEDGNPCRTLKQDPSSNRTVILPEPI